MATPALVTVAMAVLLLDHVPKVFGVTLAVVPIQTELAPPNTGLAGTAFITTFDDETDVQLTELVIVKV